MEFYEQLEQGRYGSFELKRLVGRNLMKGLVISIVVHALVVASPYIVKLFQSDEEIPPPPIRVVDISQLTKLKSQQETQPQIKIAQPKLAPAKAVIPVAVPEDIIEEQQLMPTQTEIAASVSQASDSGLDIRPGEQFVVKDDEAIPDVGVYVPFQVAPQPLPDFSPQPAFPDIAKMSGLEGKVTCQVYVDKKGEVRKYLIVQAKPKGMGFEEEVEKIIMKWKFTPAIQQGNPVGVWISIPFIFKYQKS